MSQLTASRALASRLTVVLVPALAILVLALPAQAGADEQATTTSTAQPASSEATAPGAGATTPQAPSTPAPGPTEGSAEPGSETAAGPQVEAQHTQSVTPGGSANSGKGSTHAKAHGGSDGAAPGGQPQTTGGITGLGRHANHRAPSPSTLTPALPLTLGGSISGVPDFFVESFRIPPFLLPIYQAAGTAYGIPWQVLAAINEVETDYGRDLSVSSASAEGWMQFLPSTWAQYGVDANGDGFQDPYNPADAIFAAARYLRAAGGNDNIRAAVYSYNHSQAYVDSVMLRAQLLGGTPPELLGAVTGLTEARFPVHAPSHFSDGFATVPAHDGSETGHPAKMLVGTTIYSRAGAPVIAVRDGEIVQIGDSPSLGRFVSLRDGYGNTYVYAQLGSVASLYPVLQPHEHTAVSARIAQSAGAADPAPSGPATAGAQPRSPVSEGAAVSGLALGATASLEPSPTVPEPVPAQSTQPVTPPPAPTTEKVFRSGPNDVYLHPLRAGVQVITGTVLGHIGADEAGAGGRGTDSTAGAGHGPQSGWSGGPHMFFQVRPTGIGAPLIDPKPILDGWVALENTSIFRAKGENPFLATSPTTGQVLLESKGQLEQQVVRDSSIHMRDCERQDVQTGRVDKRVLATLEYLSVSGLKPTVSGLSCPGAAPATEGYASSGETVKIAAVNGVPIAGHQGQGSITDTTIRKLLMLEGENRPRRIISTMSFSGTKNTLARPSARDYIYVSFESSPLGRRPARGAHAADVLGSALTSDEWIKLIARLGEIPDPTVASGPSSAAIPNKSDAGKSPAGEGASSGNN